MKIIDLLNTGKITISMEVFPPKTSTAFDSVEKAVRGIAALHPTFVSCTYGAGGGTSEYTVKITKEVLDMGVPAMAHLTCISSDRDTIEQQIDRIREAGIENILALRGDIPQGFDVHAPHRFQHAIQLIHEIHALYPEACIGGACYPEKHPEAASKEEDILHIREKVDAGCNFLTTQMFFDNSIYYNYLYRLREAGVMVPVLAGIMPVTTRRQMERSIQLSGCIIPARFKAMVDMFGGNPGAMKQAGIIYATEQIVDLISNGIRHIHLYTMNKPEIAEAILRNISAITGIPAGSSD
ncbi:methylenetetrahydrofolate reductase [Clostridium vitabionis]|uniref:methylenetetrahydrofolate reductase n=1 Tax=Clostridium vitabionis TaxID=2784388 RepID=UPI00188C740B|nr:methylenetetrahydrofolate reductase [Clostridium vitabionis]